MTQTAVPGRPRVESLLAAAHRNHSVLEQRCAALRRTGIAPENLPEPTARMAFALLGDHDRAVLTAALREHWGELQSKGLVSGAIDAATTAELRLFAHVREHTAAIGSVWEQLREADGAPAPPHGVWHCARRVRGLWGQRARLHFVMEGMRHLLIEPDPVFGLQPAVVAAASEQRQRGSFEFPIDNGEIRISMRHRSGALYRHVVEAMVEGVS